ncbi:ATP-binding protein [Nonomuraea deserti]|uniref:ATP-binding protein n=1 Tax=Nonomuraea deserti TaxID=1848322 RepID=UPI001C7034E9|nr:ATP-binding protein [Nonomuraea deserti]
MSGRLTELRLTRFKAFRDAALPLGSMTILIGRNSSGKSNALWGAGSNSSTPPSCATYSTSLGKNQDRATVIRELSEDKRDCRVILPVTAVIEIGNSLIAGAGTGVPLSDHVMSKLGLGDLCILTERELYSSRVTGVDVGIWTLDEQLRSHS